MLRFNFILLSLSISILTSLSSNASDLEFVKNITNSSGFVVAGDTLFFIGSTSQNGPEVWKSNGTTAGTVLTEDIIAGPTGCFQWSIKTLTAKGNQVFFFATDGVNGAELWKTTGGTPGAVMVKDIFPGATGSQSFGSPQLWRPFIYNVNDTMYFLAKVPAYGAELWKSDGTDTGTALVKDIVPGSAPADLNPQMAKFNGKLYLVAGAAPTAGLWVSDGCRAARNDRP